MDKSIKILVIDDNKENLSAAKEQLRGYNVRYCFENFEVEQIFEKTDGQYPRRFPFIEEFDVVLTDLFLPVSLSGTDSEKQSLHNNTEKPYGLVFAMGALIHGVKKVGIITNANRHADPILWSLSAMGISGKRYIGDSKLFYSNSGGDGLPKDWKGMLDSLLAE